MPTYTRMRRTKIVATIGPASDTLENIMALINAGMNVARINLSFGANNDQDERVKRIRLAAKELGKHIAVMIDTRGIEIRSGKLEDQIAVLRAGQDFILYTDGRLGNSAGASMSYKNLPNEVEEGTPILMDDGALELVVKKVINNEIRCRIVVGGTLRENKSINLPETELAMSAVSPENRAYVQKEMAFAAKHDVEYVAASFVQNADDIYKMREVLAEHGKDIPIIAKIENKAGVANLKEIVEAANGLMVARGDLGVELPLADVPATQKEIIRATVSAGKPVITATEMLASMERNPKPTRAEASDVANAILDGTSAVMLSGETAVGKYPVKAVQIMHELALRAEMSLKEYGYLQLIKPHPSHKITEAVSQAANNMATHIGARAIIALTETGFTARMISKHRPDSPIMAITGSKKEARRLALNWGIQAIHYKGKLSDEEKLQYGIEHSMKQGCVQNGDTVIVTAGINQSAGGTDFIRVITIQ